jgi:hypothetical protein
MPDRKVLIVIFAAVVVVVAAGAGLLLVLLSSTGSSQQADTAQGAADYKNATYTIDSRTVQLVNGHAETAEADPYSGSKIVTQYFGNEIKTDLNDDGREDVAFIVTQNTGGSGTFYYAVAALNTNRGFVGSDAYFLGDRIAPQTTTLSPNQNQKGVVVFNYAERKPNEPMTAKPSVGKSVYLKLDPKTMQWGIVQPNFEGESNLPSTGKLNIVTICQDALSYMTFPAGTNDADKFVADCKAGKHPEVIEKYKTDHNLNGATI